MLDVSKKFNTRCRTGREKVTKEDGIVKEREVDK
jgi:hypothetical protein